MMQMLAPHYSKGAFEAIMVQAGADHGVLGRDGFHRWAKALPHFTPTCPHSAMQATLGHLAQEDFEVPASCVRGVGMAERIGRPCTLLHLLSSHMSLIHISEPTRPY